MRNQLLTQLTIKTYSYPTTFAELVDSADNFKFIGVDPKYLRDTNLPQINSLAERMVKFELTNPTIFFTKMVSGKNVFLGANLPALTDLLTSKSDKFTFLEEKYFWSQYVYYVSKRFRYWRETVKM